MDGSSWSIRGAHVARRPSAVAPAVAHVHGETPDAIRKLRAQTIVVRRERTLKGAVDDEKPAISAVFELAVEPRCLAVELAADVGAEDKEDVGRPIEQALAYLEELALLRLHQLQRDGAAHREEAHAG